MIGACLAHSGFAVSVVGSPASMANYPDQLQLESPFGNFRVPVEHSAVVPAADVLWITVKATQLEPALAALPDGERVGAIVPLLNGVEHVPALRAKYGASRVIPATIAVESERVGPGHIVHRSPFAILSVASGGKAILGDAVEKLAQIGFTCRFVDDEATLLWSKLVFLAPIALVTTASGRVIGDVLSEVEWRQKLFACTREVGAVSRAEGASVDIESVISTMSGLPPYLRSSMQKDVERGNIPELDAIAGAVLRGADRHHIAVPIARELVSRVESRVAALKA